MSRSTLQLTQVGYDGQATSATNHTWPNSGAILKTSRPLPLNPWHSPKALRSDGGKNPPAWCHRSSAHLAPLGQNDKALQLQRRDIHWTTSGELVPRNNPTCSCVETDPELNLAIFRKKLAEAQYIHGLPFANMKPGRCPYVFHP